MHSMFFLLLVDANGNHRSSFTYVDQSPTLNVRPDFLPGFCQTQTALFSALSILQKYDNGYFQTD